ncbi:hypothetical protein HDU76_003403 [Blyttiomyces sp. JEL0837]|nr:hypothetical protein HDU76_003403 [Blyttiomyces sp. JEL0837]
MSGSIIAWKFAEGVSWKLVLSEWFYFNVMMWTTWLLLTGSFTIGYDASQLGQNWVVSIGTVFYLGVLYPFGKSVLMWLLQRQLFWVRLYKRLKEAGAGPSEMLGYQMNLYYLYDLLFSLAGKILILRAKNLPTLAGSTGFRISSRFLASVLYLRRIVGDTNEPPATSLVKVKATQVAPTEGFGSLPPYHGAGDNEDTGHMEAPRASVPGPIAIIIQDEGDSSLSQQNPKRLGKAETLLRMVDEKSSLEAAPHQKHMMNSLYYRLAQKVQTYLAPNEDCEHKVFTSRFVDFIEQTVVVLDLDNNSPESIGICGIANTTSDLFSKLTAAAILRRVLSVHSGDDRQCDRTVSVSFDNLLYLAWILAYQLDWKAAFKEWLHFTTALWTTWLLLVGSFTIGYSTTELTENWMISMGTILYLAVIYPLAKSAIMWALQKQIFWVTLQKRLKENGASESVLLAQQMNLYYLYDLLLSLAGKILLLRAPPNLPTFYLSLAASTLSRIGSRFLAAILSFRRIVAEGRFTPLPSRQATVLTRRNHTVIARMPTFRVQGIVKPVRKITPDELEEDVQLPKFDFENQITSPCTIVLTEENDSLDGPSKVVTRTSLVGEMNPSFQLRMAQKIESNVTSSNLQLNNDKSSKVAYSSRFLDFVEQTVVVLDIENSQLESIGICGFAGMISDLMSKLAAGMIVFIMLGYDASWAECRGSVDVKNLAIEFVSTLAVTLLVDIPYTIFEMRDVGYNLTAVIAAVGEVQLGWSLYAFLLCAAASCLCAFITAEVGIWEDSECFVRLHS